MQHRRVYPEYRAADIDATTEQYLRASPLTEKFLPGLGRLHKLHARGEASRRATRLSYATHHFKSRHGRWPYSLGELAAEYGREIATDPFTGNNFGYRITDEGPVIYSASENGVDDGGLHSPRWDDGLGSDTESDDYVFWPPQPRP